MLQLSQEIKSYKGRLLGILLDSLTWRFLITFFGDL